MTEHGFRISRRPPDAALSEVDVTFLGQEDRIRALVEERNWLEKRIEVLSVALVEECKGTGTREVALVAKLREEERSTRRASYLAAALFIALCWCEGWRVALWVWDHVWRWMI